MVVIFDRLATMSLLTFSYMSGMTVWEKYSLEGITYLESRALTRSQNPSLLTTLKGRKSLTMKFAIFAVINLALSELCQYVFEFLKSSYTVG